MRARALPDRAYLQECFSYDPISGDLRWKERPASHFAEPWHAERWNRRYAGRPAGVVVGIGYRIVTLDDRPYKAHRIIWKIITGDEPRIIDHWDRHRANNRWVNLRNGSQANNRHNSPKMRPHTQFKGCRFRRGKWSAAIADIHLGTFETGAEASAAYQAAAIERYSEFASQD